jgi:transcription-repair coupling factor (superfamily II helicase)
LCKKQFYLQNEEKQTPAGLRLLLTFDNVKNTRTALEFMELLGGE